MANQVTEVRLMSVPLENDYKHTLYFANELAQRNYFISKTKYSMSECSYQRKEKYISFNNSYDEIKHCNYLMFRNPFFNQSGSTPIPVYYYAFITRMEYKSDSVTWVYFEIDVMQTYFFQKKIKPSFVEREHTATDEIGEHTVPENLECGEYIVKYAEDIEELLNLWNVVGVTANLENKEVSNVYDGLYSGVGYCAFPGAYGAQQLIKKYASSTETGTDAITSLFMYPEIFISNVLKNNPEADQTEFYNSYVQGSTTPKTLDFNLSRRASYTYTSYNPRNNKLKAYPYLYLNVSNNNGASAIYQFEHFEADVNENVKFVVRACICPGGSIRLIPQNYKGLVSNEEEGLNLGKFAIGSWANDVYTNWLTQNGVNIALTMASGIGQIVGGVATGGATAVGGVSTIAGQMAQIHQMSMTPPQAQGNINCGDIITASKHNTFTFYTMRIKDEYLRIIDGFFDMFGYKVNSLKVPNENHRENYWYTKTVDISIDGDIPGDDMQKIKDCYNRGITFWRYPDNIGDYTVNNDVKE